MRKVNLDNVGKYRGDNYDWSSSVGQNIEFEYDDVCGNVFVEAYNKENKKLIVQYLGIKFEISPDSLKNARLANIVNNIFVNNKDLASCIVGDYSEIMTLTIGSSKKVKFRCPHCGTIKNAIISDVFRQGLSCRKCGDGISYPEKYIYCLLEQLGENFVCQYTFEGKFFYDFYLPSKQIVIEANGLQHYDVNNNWYREGSDDAKLNALSSNGIHCVSIDCSRSDSGFIQKSIKQSDLKNIYNLESIDWTMCDKNACSSILVAVNKAYNASIHDINSLARMFHVGRSTVIRYLKKGQELGISLFRIENLYEERTKKMILGSKSSCSKKIMVVKNDECISVFNSISELSRCSKEQLGVELQVSHIGQCAKMQYGRKSYKGFTFKFL